MPNTYKLTYFNFTGRGETIRLIFAASGVKFQDNRIDGAAWGKLKPSEFEILIYRPEICSADCFKT
jgi:glutathione S-transferase